MLRKNLLALCLLPSAALAKDTIWLDNGDRIVGDIVFKNRDHLVVSTGYAGRISIKWDRVETLETEKPIMVSITGVDETVESKLDISENDSVICHKCPVKIIALKDVDTLVYSKPWINDFHTEGRINLSAEYERMDSDIDQYNVDYEVRMFHGKWRHVLDGTNELKSEDEEVSEDNWDSKYRLDRFFGKHFYARVGVEYERDHVSEVYRERNYSAGPGYLFWDNELGRFDTTLSYERFRFDIANEATGDSIELDFNAVQLSWDFKRALFGDRFSFYMNGDAAIPEYDDIYLVLEADFGLTYKISGWLSANLSYEIDDTKTSIGNNRDYQFKMGLGARW